MNDIDKIRELHQLEMKYRLTSTLQADHAYKLEEIMFWRGSIPGSDHVKLKVGQSFVFIDDFGTYFQKSGAMTIYVDRALELDLSTYTDEQITSMKKQNTIDKLQYESHKNLLEYFDKFNLYCEDRLFYPIGMYVRYNKLMIHGSFSSRKSNIDRFTSFTALKKVPKCKNY